MVILIDAYNMLKQNGAGRFISLGEQTRFLDCLSAYGKRKDHHIIVVFDGGPAARQTESSEGHLTVVYAGQASSADEAIKNRIPGLPCQNTLLVTSDRELRAYAARHGLLSLEPRVFNYYSRLEAAEPRARVVKDKGKAHKLEGHESSSDVDALMEKASRIIYHKDVHGQEKKQGTAERGQKLSKQARKLAALIEKL